MSANSSIEWTDATWNPITGCSVYSPGCKNCYAMKLAGGRLQRHPSRAGLTQPSVAGPVWTGEVRFNEEFLEDPWRWRKPRRIFVCAHSDLFHESVPDAWIDRVFDVMASAPKHTFQVLTKRATRMREYLSRFRPSPKRDGFITRDGVEHCNRPKGEVLFHPGRFPLPNVWLGVSVEDQTRADERIPELLATPAAVRWISAEPLLELVKLNRWLLAEHGRRVIGAAPGIDWVVAGGESGTGARPMHPEWATAIRDACRRAGVPFHFKQWGAWQPIQYVDAATKHGLLKLVWTKKETTIGGRAEGTQPINMIRVGKKAAGRLLDGVQHDGMPA